jgi:hypothetical protein
MTSQSNKVYFLGPYRIHYPSHLRVETFREESYDGIIFIMEDARYQLINNYAMGTRLIINPHDGGFKDMPFNVRSFAWLPEGVTATEIQDERK